MGNAIVVLCTNIPTPSISKINSSNSDMKISASSWLTILIDPIWKTMEKIPKNTKNKIIRSLFTSTFFLNNIWELGMSADLIKPYDIFWYEKGIVLCVKLCIK